MRNDNGTEMRVKPKHRNFERRPCQHRRKSKRGQVTVRRPGSNRHPR